MSVIVKGMEMPKNCTCCWLSRGVYCVYHNSDWVGDHQAKQTKPDWCPLVELPEDSVSVVRCKDCKYFDDYETYCLCTNPEKGWHTKEDNYCESGERRDKNDKI